MVVEVGRGGAGGGEGYLLGRGALLVGGSETGDLREAERARRTSTEPAGRGEASGGLQGGRQRASYGECDIFGDGENCEVGPGPNNCLGLTVP